MSEREAFEEWVSKETKWDLYWSKNINQYMDHQTNAAWLSWQASANREGYKLVPVEPTEEMIDAGVDESDVDWKRLKFAYQAMIGEKAK